MEVHGRKIRQSFKQGSDDVHVVPCSPCAKEGKNVAAAKHCVECDENLCSTCLSHHNKFSVMKGHQLLDTVKTPSGGQRPELPSQRCDKHGGKLMDVYCPDHDKVGCSTCIAVEHSACVGISFIPDVVKHSNSSEELQQLETAINSLQSRYILLKQKQQTDLDNLKQEKQTLLHEIRSERKKINDQLDQMETNLLHEVDTSFQKKTQNINANIKEVEDNLASLMKDQQKIQAAKQENASEKYVQVKLGHEKMKLSNDRLEDMKRSNKIGRLWFDPCTQITSSKDNIIGRVINYPAVACESFIGEFDVSVKTDGDSCKIRDICQCADGNIVMTDYQNKRVKKMNEAYTVTSYLTVKDNPFGVCQINASLLAVTLINTKRVQFVSQKETMKLQKSFGVGDRCRDIAYNDGLIYVCCGGSEKRKEGAGRLEVYALSGALITSYYGAIGCPYYVTVPKWTMDIFVVDGDSGFLVINRDGHMRKNSVNDMKVYDPVGICWINKNQLCLAGYSSNNVVMMSCDGKLHEELLSTKDGIADTTCVYFDENQSRLVLSTYENNKINVYTLNISNC